MGAPDVLREDSLEGLSDHIPEAHSMAEMKAIGEREKVLIPLLAHVLEALVEKNDRSNSDRIITAFHALKPPGVSVREYIERIRKYSACSPCCFIVGLVYMDRFMQRTQGFVLSTLSIHRLLLASVLLAAKFLDDFYYNNNYWGKVGGIPIAEMNALELELLFRLNFDLHITTEDYIRYRGTLLASWARPLPHHMSPGGNATNPLQIANGGGVVAVAAPKRKLARDFEDCDPMVDDAIKQQNVVVAAAASDIMCMDTR